MREFAEREGVGIYPGVPIDWGNLREWDTISGKYMVDDIKRRTIRQIAGEEATVGQVDRKVLPLTLQRRAEVVLEVMGGFSPSKGKQPSDHLYNRLRAYLLEVEQRTIHEIHEGKQRLMCIPEHLDGEIPTHLEVEELLAKLKDLQAKERAGRSACEALAERTAALKQAQKRLAEAQRLEHELKERKAHLGERPPIPPREKPKLAGDRSADIKALEDRQKSYWPEQIRLAEDREAEKIQATAALDEARRRRDALSDSPESALIERVEKEITDATLKAPISLSLRTQLAEALRAAEEEVRQREAALERVLARPDVRASDLRKKQEEEAAALAPLRSQQAAHLKDLEEAERAWKAAWTASTLWTRENEAVEKLERTVEGSLKAARSSVRKTEKDVQDLRQALAETEWSEDLPKRIDDAKRAWNKASGLFGLDEEKRTADRLVREGDRVAEAVKTLLEVLEAWMEEQRRIAWLPAEDKVNKFWQLNRKDAIRITCAENVHVVRKGEKTGRRLSRSEWSLFEICLAAATGVSPVVVDNVGAMDDGNWEALLRVLEERRGKEGMVATHRDAPPREGWSRHELKAMAQHTTQVVGYEPKREVHEIHQRAMATRKKVKRRREWERKVKKKNA